MCLSQIHRLLVEMGHRKQSPARSRGLDSFLVASGPCNFPPFEYPVVAQISQAKRPLQGRILSVGIPGRHNSSKLAYLPETSTQYWPTVSESPLVRRDGCGIYPTYTYVFILRCHQVEQAFLDFKSSQLTMILVFVGTFRVLHRGVGKVFLFPSDLLSSRLAFCSCAGYSFEIMSTL